MDNNTRYQTKKKFMSRLWILAISVMIIVFPVHGTSMASDPSMTQVNSLQELVDRFDSSSCRECHEQIFTQWEKSHHSRSLMGINDYIFIASYLKKGPLAIPSGEKATKKNFPCFKCHFPQIEFATDSVAAEIAKAALDNDKVTVRKLNIGCLVCHREKAVVHGRPDILFIWLKRICQRPNLHRKRIP